MIYKVKPNKEGTAFVCQTQEDTKKAIKLSKKYGNKGKLEIERPVSKQFRGYYFAGVIGFIHRLGLYPELARLDINYKSKKTGMTLKDVYHEFLKRDYNGVDVPISDEETRTVGMSIAIKDSGKFNDYIDRINADLSKNYSMRLPTPTEYRHYRDTIYSDFNAPEFVDYFYNKQLDDIM